MKWWDYPRGKVVSLYLQRNHRKNMIQEVHQWLQAEVYPQGDDL